MAYESHLHSAFWQKTSNVDRNESRRSSLDAASGNAAGKEDEDFDDDDDCEGQSEGEDDDEEISVT